ncbi:MAG TPA: leucyl aminopeptidase [Candidatus Nitrosocosmicus sp.]
MVNITVKNYNQIDLTDSLFVVGVQDDISTDLGYLDKMPSGDLCKKITSAVKNIKEIPKKFGKSLLFFCEGENNTYIKILLLGIGKYSELDSTKIRQLGGIISIKAKELQCMKIIISDFYKPVLKNVESIVEGLSLSLYEFNKYKKDIDDNKSDYFDLCQVHLLSDENNNLELEQLVEKTLIISQSVFFARDLANSPPNVISPTELANIAASIDNTNNKVKVKILDKYQMENLGLNGIIAVGKGSQNPPKLIILEHNRGVSGEKPILLVGKAVTFDTGGISIKPSDKMDEMKFDKSGGCNVLGIFKALSMLDIKLNVVGIIPSVENMPSSSSYRPGDILQMYNGKTVEVLNTDAEGRLILADGLSYGIEHYSPKAVIDFATLTGACIIALGTNVAGIMGNDDILIQKIIQSSVDTGEKIWQLPLFEEFHDLIKSNVANIKNIGGRTGGAITAAAFLAHFVNDVSWAHVDIAGTAWTQDGTIEKSYNPKGATGFGIRTIIKLLESNTL